MLAFTLKNVLRVAHLRPTQGHGAVSRRSVMSRRGSSTLAAAAFLLATLVASALWRVRDERAPTLSSGGAAARPGRWTSERWIADAATAGTAEVDGNGTHGGTKATARSLDEAPTCDDAGVAAAAAAVREWAARWRHPTSHLPFYSRTLTLATLADIHECATDYEGSTTAAHFALVVMAGSKFRQRLVAMQAAWGARAAAAGAHLIYVSDVADAALGTVVLPGAEDPSYEGAQNRSLKGLQHAVATLPDARWYWMVDDDTFVRRFRLTWCRGVRSSTDLLHNAAR